MSHLLPVLSCKAVCSSQCELSGESEHLPEDGMILLLENDSKKGNGRRGAGRPCQSSVTGND